MYKNLINIRAIVFVFGLFLLLMSDNAGAQTRISSPYSRFGLGEIQFQQNFRNMGMGGLGIGYRSNQNVNYINPASYTAFDSTSFVFEAVVFSHFYEQITDERSQMSNYTSLGSLTFGFPVSSWWGVGLGLKPFSSVGYKIRDFEDQDDLGRINYLYEGEGGINQVFIGNAFKLGNFSLGVNASYLWGDLERHSTVYSDSTGFFLTNQIKANTVNGWHFGFGAQYFLELSDTRNITLGATFGNDEPVNVSTSQTLQRMLPGITRFDTISHQEGVSDQIVIPLYWGAGTFVRFNSRWAAGLDMQWQNWETFEMFDENEGLNNSYQLAFGLQHNPTVQTFSSFLSRIEYRAGLRYGQTYLPMETPVNEFGISFGLSLPVRRTLSGLNLSFEYGKRGNNDHPIKENFFKINLGVNVFERWFVRSRFY